MEQVFSSGGCGTQFLLAFFFFRVWIMLNPAIPAISTASSVISSGRFVSSPVLTLLPLSIFFYSALITRSLAGIVAGICWSHPAKVYPVLVGFAGFVIAEP